MHNLALALNDLGYQVSGSDDEVFEPSRSRLSDKGLLPKEMGWFPEKITTDLDAVILGMHARIDNPELARAKELSINIYSYPEYLYESSERKKRVVIGGSHGKTSITSMILHVLHHENIDTDYMVGAQLEGFTNMVRITEGADIMILEGDEYLSSPIDRRPKFHLYYPHIALLSGIAWDHINVFPTFENYVDQFREFTNLIEKDGTLIYYDGDSEIVNISKGLRPDIKSIPYNTPQYRIENGITLLNHNGKEYPLSIFGEHNLQNLKGAWHVLNELGLDDESILNAIQSFKGASKRLELIYESHSSIAYKDFAHSPSKLKATTSALKSQFPERSLVACMELHTFSSLSSEFLKQYSGAMDAADIAYVYYNPETLNHKKLPPISPEMVEEGFGQGSVKVLTNSKNMVELLSQEDWKNKNLLLMSSGNFDGLDFVSLAESLMS